LGQLQRIEKDVTELGYQILAVSADKPANLQPTVEKGSLAYTLLSDADLEAAKAFGIAFQVDEATVERYRGFGIDLEKVSGETHHQLPVPGVFIFDDDAKLAFEYVNPDYRVRIPADLVLAAARTFAK
jgi:peroxiredoxin